MKIKYTFYIFIIPFFFQCKTNQIGQIKKEIKRSYSIKYLNKEEFEKSRSLMFENLSPSIVNNDSIILIESFYNVNGHYSYRIYESNNRQTKRYVAQRSIRNKKIQIDSLVLYPNVPDKILNMVRQGKLDEIKRRGDATTLTPAATLIINIGVKNKEKKKFDFTTLITQEFSIENKQ